MKTLGLGLMVLALSSLLGATALKADEPKKAPVNKYCAVEGEPHEVDATVTYEYKGKVIGFCCADCIEPFKKDPEKFMKNLK